MPPALEVKRRRQYITMRRIYVPPWPTGSCKPAIDYGTEKGASILAERIMEAWRRAGHHNVYAWPERAIVRTDANKPHYIVKTNLVNGLPPRGGR